MQLRLNSKGLRDFEYPYEKKKGTYRILALGDSFTEGVQVPLKNTFAKGMERRLNSTNRKFEVINAGVSAYGTTNEYLFLIHEGLKYHPDMVLLCFYMGNDVWNNSYALKIKSMSQTRLGPYFTLTKNDLELHYPQEKYGQCHPTNTSRFAGIKDFLTRNSGVYQLLRDRIKGIYPLAVFLEKIGILERDPFPDEFNVFSLNYSSDWKDAWEITKRIILKINKELDKREIQFKIVIFPFLGQVDERDWEAILKRYQTPEDGQWSLARPNQILVEFCQEHNIAVLDLLPAFREYTERTHKSLYFQHDGHFNEAGHQLTAKNIYRAHKLLAE